MKATQVGVEAESRRAHEQEAKAKKARERAFMKGMRKESRRSRRGASEALAEILNSEAA